MGRRTRGPRLAWYSGYRVSYETWCEWSETLPKYQLPPGYWVDPRHFNYEDRGERYYLLGYIDWKDRLPLKHRRKLPRPRYEYVETDYFIEDEDDEYDTPPVSVFLPVRWVEFSSDDQVVPGKPDYDEKIRRELESDRKQFQHFLKFVEEQGAPLSEDKVEFGWQKELDPHDDWKTY